MPVARIVTPLVDKQSQALTKLTERLRLAGFDVDIAAPDTLAGEADLVLEIGEMPTEEALDTAFDLARRDDADLYLAPGLFTSAGKATASAATTERAAPERADDDVVASVMELCGSEPHALESEREFADASALAGNDEIEPPAVRASSDEEELKPAGPSVIGQTVQQLGAAIQEGSSGIRDTLAGVYGRVAGTLSELQQRRAETMQAMREQRERREAEREQQRREHELELQRQAEERQRLTADRERQAAERERELREQQTREAALRAEIERIEREAMAREAARRAQEAEAAEQERRRQAALEAERVRIAREQEAKRAAAVAAERARQEQERQRVVASAVELTPSSQSNWRVGGTPSRVSPVPAMPTAEPLPRPRLVPPPHRRPTTRERQWQRAAFVASIATLAAMIGFAIAANRNPVSPLPQALKQNEVQQQVPFGPARIDVSSAKVPRAPAHSLSPVLSSPLPSRNGELGGTPVASLSARKPVSQKPSAAREVSKRPARRASTSADNDEVIVRHLRPQPTDSAKQSTVSGVRHYSDQN